MPVPSLNRLIRRAAILALVLAASGTAPAMVLSQARALGEGRYELLGEFGAAHARGEVVVTFADGFRYTALIERWQPARLLVNIADLNRGLNVTLAVRGNSGASSGHSLRLTPWIVPPSELTMPQPETALSSYGFFEREHRLAVGDKGEDVFDVSAPAPACGRPTRVFQHARIVYREQRFGQAQIVALPPAGCVHCSPLKVRWYHEPTGRLVYQLHVYRRVVEGVCADRQR